jgi:hypothetical protein
VSHHYGHYQEKGESDTHYVKRSLGPAMLGIATASEVDWYMTCVHELDDSSSRPSDRCLRAWGRRIVQRIFAHAYRGKR